MPYVVGLDCIDQAGIYGQLMKKPIIYQLMAFIPVWHQTKIFLSKFLIKESLREFEVNILFSFFTFAMLFFSFQTQLKFS